MTPKEKAIELYNKFNKHTRYWDCFNDEPLEEDHTKQCAIIAVDEILNVVSTVRAEQYWKSVKQEIEKL